MSIHPSLRLKRGALGSLRNVLKRHERVRHLMAQGLWTEGRSMLGLPKIKQTKVKVRKAAPQEKKAEATATATTTPETTSAAKK